MLNHTFLNAVFSDFCSNCVSVDSTLWSIVCGNAEMYGGVILRSVYTISILSEINGLKNILATLLCTRYRVVLLDCIHFSSVYLVK